MDAGLLNALSAGVQSGTESYQRARASAEEAALRRRQQQLAAAQTGLQEVEGGGFEQTPEAKERKSLEKATTQAGLLKSGYRAVKNPLTGEFDLVPIPGFKDEDKELRSLQRQKLINELKEGKKPTAGEFAAAGYAKRLEQAENVFGDLASKGYDPTSKEAYFQGFIPDVAGSFRTSEFQQQGQAERNFVNAVLRRESGAAISPSEFESATKQYFPRPGDSPEVLKQKALNRSIVAQNIKAESAKAYDKSPSVAQLAAQLPSFEKKSQGLIPEAQAAEGGVRPPKIGYIEAGYEFKGGDPSDKKNWKKVQ